MREVLPRYKIVFEDLQELGIGHYLISREFKVSMSKKGFFDVWDGLMESANQKRNFVAIGHDHSYTDSLTSLADLFNSIQNNQVWDRLVGYIVSGFISSLKFKLDLGHLKESFELAEFSDESLNSIFNEIELNSQKPEKPKKKVEIDKQKDNSIKSEKSKVFIVHGHDEGLKQSVARFLDKLKLNPVIIVELPSGGKTIIEQIESNSDVDFAVVLMTGDDEGKKKGEKRFKSRARQNVILELGYFFGKLGRQHVLVIYENGVEMPSDFLGILHVPYDSGEAWKMRLAKELKNSGFEIDLNKVF